MSDPFTYYSPIHRIIFGYNPLSFLIEITFRTIIIIVLLQFVIRPLDKRMSGQLTIAELSIIIMLGAIIGNMAELPDKGLLQGAFALFLIVLCQRSLTWLGVHNRNIEQATQGELSLFVKEGVIQLPALKKARITKAQLYTILRTKNIYQLGQVKRVYLEASGSFSIYLAKKAKPGLPTQPPKDKALNITIDTAFHACNNCGNVQSNDLTCYICGNNHWEPAVIKKNQQS